MARKSPKQRLALIFSLVMFGSSGLFGAMRLYGAATAQLPPQTAASQSTELEQQLKGYEQVLQREPNNQTALEGLAQTHLQMQHPKQAIAPLEKLVKLHPDRADYAMLLTRVQQAKQS